MFSGVWQMAVQYVQPNPESLWIKGTYNWIKYKNTIKASLLFFPESLKCHTSVFCSANGDLDELLLVDFSIQNGYLYPLSQHFTRSPVRKLVLEK